MLDAQPALVLQVPPQVMIGESFQLTATFDNTHATDVGFGPFVDLYVPVNGSDGVGGVGADGISFTSAQYLGTPVTTTVLIFPDNGGGTGAVTHPYAVDNTGTPLTVSGPAGDQLIVLQLPFGSFTADQPAAEITVNMQLSGLADLSQVLNLRGRAGFQYGNDAIANPTTDPTLLSDPSVTSTAWTNLAPVEPILIRLEKIYIGPEDETATGPNFPRQYTIEVDVADGQTITNLDVIDRLPNNMQLVSVDTISPAGSTTTTPTTPANAPDNELVIAIPSVTGTTATNDATVTFTYFIPFRDADGQLVNDSVSGNDATSPNHAAALGDWDPTDTRDDDGVDNASVDVVTPEHVLTPKSIAIQKSVAILNDVGNNGLSPGDTLEYQLAFQVSDFFAFQNLIVNDILSDGQRFDGGFTPTLQVVEHGANSDDDIAVANFSVIDHFTGSATPVAPINGTQEVVVRVSNELITRTLDGVLLGGLVPTVGTGGGDPNSATFDAGATTGVITFHAIVQEDFTDTFPSLDASVDEGDVLRNDVTITGDVLSYTNVGSYGAVRSG